MKTVSSEMIDAILPQTQCGLCTYGACKPYADAMAHENAPINLCPPGGVKGLKALGELLNQDPRPYIAEMEEKSKPKVLAVIREADCIGCTKCIQACPVDAILGAAKEMHTIISTECTGCELCVAPCPVDCIDLVAITEESNLEKTNQFRMRYEARQLRLEHQEATKTSPLQAESIDNKKAYILAALARVKSKQ